MKWTDGSWMALECRKIAAANQAFLAEARTPAVFASDCTWKKVFRSGYKDIVNFVP